MRKKSKNIVAIAMVVACFMFNQAFAGEHFDNMLDQINNSAALGVNMLNLNYKETFLSTEDPRLKSTEAGNIFGFMGNVRAAFAEKIYTDFYFDYYIGKLKYDGADRDNLSPLAYNANHKFFNASVKTGYIFTLTDNQVFQIIPYVGAGYRYWDRQYNNSSGEEKYHNYKALVGIKLNCLLTDDFALSPYFDVGKIFGAKMKAYATGLNYTLGGKPIYEGGLEVNYRMFDELFLSGFVSYACFKYGRSDVNGGFFEPDSKTNEIKGGIGIRYSWLVN